MATFVNRKLGSRLKKKKPGKMELNVSGMA
jgi:hypothetical protein